MNSKTASTALTYATKSLNGVYETASKTLTKQNLTATMEKASESLNVAKGAVSAAYQNPQWAIKGVSDSIGSAVSGLSERIKAARQ